MEKIKLFMHREAEIDPFFVYVADMIHFSKKKAIFFLQSPSSACNIRKNKVAAGARFNSSL